jgi:hypothetical protein
MPDRQDIREAARLIEVAKKIKDPRARAEILELAEACLRASGHVMQQQQQPQMPTGQKRTEN